MGGESSSIHRKARLCLKSQEAGRRIDHKQDHR